MSGKPHKRHPVTQPLDQSIRLIPLTQHQNAIVDAADFDWLSRFNWYAAYGRGAKEIRSESYYAVRNQDRKMVWMHLEILGCNSDEEGDHRNNDTLDNRRDNLRKCSHLQNMHNARIRRDNTSGFKGVASDRTSGKFVAQIRHEGRRVKLGYFKSASDAARAYDEAALRLFGDFARLNFPREAQT